MLIMHCHSTYTASSVILIFWLLLCSRGLKKRGCMCCCPCFKIYTRRASDLFWDVVNFVTCDDTNSPERILRRQIDELFDELNEDKECGCCEDYCIGRCCTQTAMCKHTEPFEGSHTDPPSQFSASGGVSSYNRIISPTNVVSFLVLSISYRCTR